MSVPFLKCFFTWTLVSLWALHFMQWYKDEVQSSLCLAWPSISPSVMFLDVPVLCGDLGQWRNFPRIISVSMCTTLGTQGPRNHSLFCCFFYKITFLCPLGFPGGSEVKKKKNLPTMGETRVQSLGWEDPQRRKWQPTPAFLRGKFHGQRSLVGYSPWGRKRCT